MSGDTEKPVAETDSSVSSILPHSDAPIPAPGLDSSIEAEENGSKLDDGICVNGDRGSCEKIEVEMKGQEEVLNGKGNDVAKNLKHQDGTGSIAENEKDTGEIGQDKGIAEEGGENEDMDGDGKEVDEEEKEDEGDKEHEFYVGKLVWGKIRNNPWWPGQIYNPSDASDYAKKLQKSKKLLVAFFGDGSFSWCLPSQLKPFAEDFEKMSKQNTSRKFMYAVEEALNEFGRLIEFRLSQSYNLSDESRIRQGVPVPKYDISEIPQIEPVKIISLLRNVARKATFSCMLEFTVLKSWLSAFYCANGKNELAMFYEPHDIEGLEDKGKDEQVDPVLDSNEGSCDEEIVPSQQEFSVSNQAWLRKCEGAEAEKLYKRRKRKSVAKLMKEDKVVDPNNEKGNMQNDLKSGKQKTRTSEEGPSQSVLQGNLISWRKKGKKKSENIKSLEEVLNAERGGSEDLVTKEEDQVSPKKDGKEKPVSTNEKKKRSGLASIKDKILKFQKKKNKVLNAKKSGDEGQLVRKMKNKETVTEKVHKISIEEAEIVAANEEKREDRSYDRVTKGKSVDNAGEYLASPLRKMARKRKQNETLDEITGKKEGTKNGSKNKESSSENDKREETENVASKDKELSTKKIDKVIRETQNGAASREKRATRSSVKGSKEKSGNETPNHREEALSSPLGKMTRKRKQTKNLESPKIKEIKVNPKMGKKDKVIGSDNYYQEETENVRSPREKKKSMYLSPPFINYNSISRSLSPKTARMGERMTRVATEVIGSTPTLNKSNEPFLNNISKEATNTSHGPSKEEEKKIIALVQISASLKEVLSEIRSAALNPHILWDRNFLDTVEGFIFAYRNVKYLNGSYYKKYNSTQQGQKQKSLKENEKGIDEEAYKPVSLMVVFPPGFCLPLKTDLIATFSKFGPLNEMETNISHESYCAKVVFLSHSDTEKAFDTCLKESPFESAKVNYRLRYSAGSSKANEIGKKPDMLASAEFEGSCLSFIKQKLELMTKMVDNCGGNMSSELMAKLENEMKVLLDNLSSIPKSS